jgi:hypothetical protein
MELMTRGFRLDGRLDEFVQYGRQFADDITQFIIDANVLDRRSDPHHEYMADYAEASLHF